ncbi:hypothetical protein [Vibrio owensii]|uniref:hypothetical protein n=1 Tax=Vibrio owensii TaxID=696485 RepID=UPI00391F7DB2
MIRYVIAFVPRHWPTFSFLNDALHGYTGIHFRQTLLSDLFRLRERKVLTPYCAAMSVIETVRNNVFDCAAFIGDSARLFQKSMADFS